MKTLNKKILTRINKEEKAQQLLDKLWSDFPSIKSWQDELLKFYKKKRYVEIPPGRRRYSINNEGLKMKTLNKWERVPSVWTGGKTYFYNYWVDDFTKYMIVWSRREMKYELTSDRINIGFFETIKDAKKYFKNVIKNKRGEFK